MDIKLNIENEQYFILSNHVLKVNELKNAGMAHIETNTYISLLNDYIEYVQWHERMLEVKEQQIQSLLSLCGLLNKS